MYLIQRSKGNNGPPVAKMLMDQNDLEGGDGKLWTTEVRGRLNTAKDYELGGKNV